MDNIQHIILDDTLSRVVEPQFSGYICHAYCHGGSCTFMRNGNEHRMEAGDCLIIPRRGDLVENLHKSSDFSVSVIYVTQEFIEVSTPQSNYGIPGHLSLFHNPIMRLTPEMQQRCAANFEVIRLRLSQPQHNFYHEVLANAVQAMILDFFDFHAVLYGADKITSQYRQIMEQFLNMLDQGDYRTNREIGYYADKLCITPKYLSELAVVHRHKRYVRLLIAVALQPLCEEKPRSHANRFQGVIYYSTYKAIIT